MSDVANELYALSLVQSFGLGGPNFHGLDVFEAVAFAHQKHKGQKRRYLNCPYIIHPIEVLQLTDLALAPALNASVRTHILCAAVLHDVVEDTGTALSDVEERFGQQVARIVDGVTSPTHGGSCHEALSRAERKVIDAHHYGQQDYDAQTIKVADIISNCRTIAALDPDFAKVYLQEKRYLLKWLTKAPTGFWNMAERLVSRHLDRLR